MLRFAAQPLAVKREPLQVFGRANKHKAAGFPSKPAARNLRLPPASIARRLRCDFVYPNARPRRPGERGLAKRPQTG
jgi:hypothetical protein